MNYFSEKWESYSALTPPSPLPRGMSWPIATSSPPSTPDLYLSLILSLYVFASVKLSISLILSRVCRDGNRAETVEGDASQELAPQTSSPFRYLSRGLFFFTFFFPVVNLCSFIHLSCSKSWFNYCFLVECLTLALDHWIITNFVLPPFFLLWVLHVL